MTSFRCPICGKLQIKLNPDVPCSQCHSSFIPPEDIRGGDKSEKLWHDCGLHHAFNN